MNRVAYTVILMGVSLVFAVPFLPRITVCGRSADSSNIRQITQAAIIYSAIHSGTLPRAADIWDYARLLAKDGGLDAPSLWQSPRDPARADNKRINPIHILDANDPEKSRLSPHFRELKPAHAVPLFSRATALRPDLPVVWTRGLQADGTWPAHAPRLAEVGMVGFGDGRVQSFNTKRDGPAQFPRYDGNGTTSNILEALPPGTRIGQYEPTKKERIQWANTNSRDDWLEHWTQKLPAIFSTIVWSVLVLLSIGLWLTRTVYIVLPLTVLFIAVTVLTH